MKLLFLSTITIFVFACTDTTKIPQNILSKQKMERVLWDMIQAERFSALFLLKDSTYKNIQLQNFKLYEQVFAIHKISKEEFIKSYQYYLSRPDIAKVIFDSIAVKAERQRPAIYNSKPVK